MESKSGANAVEADWSAYYSRVWNRAWADWTAHIREQVAVSLGTAALAGFVAALNGAGLSSLAYALIGFLVWFLGSFAFFRFLAPSRMDAELRQASESADQERKDVTAKLSARSVGELHEEKLRASFSTLVGCLGNDLPVRYGDPDRPVLARAFAIHFPACSSAVKAYEDARAAEAAALARYEARFDEGVAARGIDKAPYVHPTARNALWDELRNAVLGGTYKKPQWRHAAEGQEFAVFSNASSWPVTGPVTADEFPAVKAELERLFDDGFVMREAGEFVVVQTKRYQATIDAIRVLDELRDVPIVRRDDCSQCQDH